MPNKRVTLADVARRAGLSTAAASLILNGKSDTRLSPEAHARVNDAAAELGYRPNVAARGLRTRKTRTIGFISDVVATTRFAGGLIQGALDAAEKAGHVLLVLETGGDPTRESKAIAAALDRQADGIIFAVMRARELSVPDIPQATNVVMLNATSNQHPVSVLPDELSGGRAAVALLADAGHRNGIALIGHNEEIEKNLFRSATVGQRIAGIRAEMAERGLRFAAAESCREWEPHHGYGATRALLEHRDDIRALLCMNDRLAFGAYQALADLGLSVPRDVSIVSFDNDELASYLRPGLTTVALPHEAMGRTSIELLLDRDPHPDCHLIPMPVIERGSVHPPTS